jgi:hypothetical protein
MDENYEIVVYATADKGEGRLMEIGRYENVDEIQDIIISMFDRDTIISFEYQKKDDTK